MKKVKLIRVYDNGYGDYNSEDLCRLVPESDLLEVTDEEYELLTDYRVRDKIQQRKSYSYYDRLIMIEDKTELIPDLIKSASEILSEIKKKEKADKERAAKAAETKKKKAEATRIQKAKELLRKAGELK